MEGKGSEGRERGVTEIEVKEGGRDKKFRPSQILKTAAVHDLKTNLFCLTNLFCFSCNYERFIMTV